MREMGGVKELLEFSVFAAEKAKFSHQKAPEAQEEGRKILQEETEITER